MERLADLHVHTIFSDGTLSPVETLNAAKGFGLCAIAITDHDCVDAVAPAISAGPEFGIEVIPGVELSADMEDEEIHILGYLINCRDEWFADRLFKLRQSRLKRAAEMVEKLKANGINIEAQEVFDFAGCGSVGRLHIARLLYNKGYTSSIYEAFEKYIGAGKPCYVRRLDLAPSEAIDMIRKIGGVSVLAHPSTIRRNEFIEDLVKMGIGGIEAYHPDMNAHQSEHYKEIAKKFGLVITGGSDCHGLAKGRLLMGKVKVPYELVEKLKEEVNKG